MTKKSIKRDFIRDLVSELRQIWQDIWNGFGAAGVFVRNRIRQLRRVKLDYIVMPVGGPLPERSGPPRGFLQRRLPIPPEPLSIEDLNARFDRIIDANDITGVILLLRELPGGMAKLSTLRESIYRLKKAGKECIAFTPYLDISHYFVATAADQIVCPPLATFETLGLNAEVIFLNDALTKLGIAVEVFQVSPYKSSYDVFSQANITPEQEEQLNWILDEDFSILIDEIAEGRGIDHATVRQLIDSAPFNSEKALEVGLIDHIAYEDELSLLFGSENSQRDEKHEELISSEKVSNHKPRKKAQIAPWNTAQGFLNEKWRKPVDEFIGVISIEGQIVMGTSRKAPIKLPIPLPLFGSNTTGEATILRLLRRAERDNRLAALIVYIDSGGGSPIASDLIYREIKRISRNIPVVAYLGNVAASGGYYVALAANKIVAQPTTLTGSIGVLSLHLNLLELYKKLSIKRVSISRGRRANLYNEIRELSPEDREALNGQMNDLYVKFKQLVADNREIDFENLEKISGGRVWTGSQAKERRLIDDIGDFSFAIEEARNMANLPATENFKVRVFNINQAPSGFILPKPFEPLENLQQAIDLDYIDNLTRKPMYLMPFYLTFR